MSGDITSALFYLRQQSVARGLAGRLGDFDVRLCEDNRTVSIWAFYELDEPLMAHIELPEPIDPERRNLVGTSVRTRAPAVR